MFGGMGRGFGRPGVAGLGGGLSQLVERNIATGGRVATTLGSPPSGKDRQQGRYKFIVFQAASHVRMVFANRYLTANNTFENAGPFDITLNKAAIEQNVSWSALLFGGAAGTTVPAGASNVRSDRTAFNILPGVAWGRIEVDHTDGTQTYPFGQYYNNATNEAASGGVEQSIFFAAANEIDQIYGTGTLSSPTGGVSQVGWAPLLLIGEVAPGVEAVIGVCDSIGVGQNDFLNLNGSVGGGFIKRAAYTASKTCFTFGITGLAASHVASAASHPMLDAVLGYHKTLINQLGSNDIAAGGTAAQLTTNKTGIDAGAKSIGISRLLWTNLLCRVTLTGAIATTLADQTAATGFGSGGQADTFNSSLAGLVSSGTINAYVDVRSTVQDSGTPTKWFVPSYSSTLAASALSTATSVSLNASPSFGDSLVFSPGGGVGVQSTGIGRVLSVTGTGPYTVTVTNAIGVAQASGVAVQATDTRDGIHPEPTPNALMAVPLAAAF